MVVLTVFGLVHVRTVHQYAAELEAKSCVLLSSGCSDLQPAFLSSTVQLLQFLGDTFDALVAAQYRLEDMEVDALLPTLLEKSGQAKERFRVAIRGLLTKVPLLCSYAKYSPLLLQVSRTPLCFSKYVKAKSFVYVSSNL